MIINTNFKHLTAEDLFKMQPGNIFRAYWRKDDDPEDVRLNFDLMVVAENKDGTITCQDCGWTFSIDQIIEPKDNILDMSGRGKCYLFESGDISAEEMMGIIKEAEHQGRMQVSYLLSESRCDTCKEKAMIHWCEKCKFFGNLILKIDDMVDEV